MSSTLSLQFHEKLNSRETLVAVIKIVYYINLTLTNDNNHSAIIKMTNYKLYKFKIQITEQGVERD